MDKEIDLYFCVYTYPYKIFVSPNKKRKNSFKNHYKTETLNGIFFYIIQILKVIFS